MTWLRVSRERLLLGAALFCLLLLAVDRLVLVPFLAAWRARADEILHLRAAVKQGTVLMEQESRWLRWRDDLAGRLLPGAAGDAESQLLGHVDGWARAAGLAVSSLRPRWSVGPDRAPRFELQVAGSGPLQSVTSFLYQLEASSLALAVEHVELVSRNAQGSEIGLDVRLIALCQGNAGKGGALP
jgi:hypothetical protein